MSIAVVVIKAHIHLVWSRVHLLSFSDNLSLSFFNPLKMSDITHAKLVQQKFFVLNNRAVPSSKVECLISDFMKYYIVQAFIRNSP